MLTDYPYSIPLNIKDTPTVKPGPHRRIKSRQHLSATGYLIALQTPTHRLRDLQHVLRPPAISFADSATFFAIS